MTKTKINDDTSSISISGGKKKKTTNTIKNIMAQNNMNRDIEAISGGSHVCKCFTCGKSMMNNKSMNRKKSNKRTRRMNR